VELVVQQVVLDQLLRFLGSLCFHLPTLTMYFYSQELLVQPVVVPDQLLLVPVALERLLVHLLCVCIPTLVYSRLSLVRLELTQELLQVLQVSALLSLQHIPLHVLGPAVDQPPLPTLTSTVVILVVLVHIGPYKVELLLQVH
jgi:hypothetical protein